MRTYEGKQVAEKIRVGIVAARFNEFITSKLLGGAIDGLVRHNVNEDDIDVAWVPGAFEIPLICQKMVDGTDPEDMAINTPLLTDPKFRISRIELNSVVRTAVGLHQNENAVYSLQKVNQNFKIGKIRILFTQSRIAFLHITLSTTDIDGDAVLSVINTFRQIISSQPRFQYNKKLSKDTTETIEISLKELVQKVVNLQKYLLVSVCDGSIMPYVQLCMVGTGKQDEKMKFFESARTLSKRPSSKEIEDKLIYTGKEPYISRFVGDRAVCIFGDTGMCGDIDLRFLTDSGNGLAKTATENYLTVYAFLISLKLIAEKNDLENPDIEYLLNAPMKLSNEENINEFFEKCLWGSAWNLKESISFIRDNIQRSNGNAVAERLGYISDQTEENNRKLEENLEIAKRIERKEAEHIELTREINQKMDVLVEFVQNDLKEYITGERAKLKASISDVDEESNICTFTRDVSTHINKKINESGDAIVDLERRSLKMLFNDRWDFLLPTSQTSLRVPMLTAPSSLQTALRHLPALQYRHNVLVLRYNPVLRYPQWSQQHNSPFRLPACPQ